MKILVINADCIQVNSSANLCHLAYLRGLLDGGHEVTLLSADGRDYKLDPSMQIPDQVTQYSYYGVSFYEKLSLKKSQPPKPAPASTDTAAAGDEHRGGILRVAVKKAKRLVRSFYGVHGIYATFVRKAKVFRSDVEYDVMLSLSTPVASHLLAYKLLKSGNVRAKKWIQIWEDPWFADVYATKENHRVYEEERRLLSRAHHICYVSPLTLGNQRRLFPESAGKMFWQPLPFYYKAEEEPVFSDEKNRYGYFGDYSPNGRNLRPFYNAAVETGIEVNICGNPSNLFPSTDRIRIHPRLPLDQLKPIEDNTNVLIFLCNLKGGQIPGKIYQYSVTRKTILFIMDGTEEEKQVLKSYFEKFNRYVFCQNTQEDIVRAIRKIESGDIGGVRNDPLHVFNPEVTINNILKVGNG